MSAVFSKPKTPKPPEPVKTPTKDDARIAVEQKDRVRRRKGRVSTILSTGRKSRTARAYMDEENKTLLGG